MLFKCLYVYKLFDEMKSLSKRWLLFADMDNLNYWMKQTFYQPTLNYILFINVVFKFCV